MMKTNKEYINEIRTEIISSVTEDKLKIILDFIDNRYKEQFENAPKEVLEIFSFVATELKLSTIRHSMYTNEIIRLSINEHVYLGNWSQLSQIHRSLPDEILNTRKNEKIAEIIDKSVQLEKQFEQLPLNEKEQLLRKRTELNIVLNYHKITTEDGLLFQDGKMIELPEADNVAKKFGFVYAERLVKYLEEKGDNNGSSK